jgi:hypothetical protein
MKVLCLPGTAFRVRVENGDFWADDGVVVEFETLEAAIVAIEEFLADTLQADMDYGADDIEIVDANDSVLCYLDLLTYSEDSEEFAEATKGISYWEFVRGCVAKQS